MMRQMCYLTTLAATACLGLAVAPSAAAECHTSGASTICSQGEVRGGNSQSPVSTYDPYQCSDPYLCLYDDYDPLIVIDPDWGINRPGGGGRPGGGNIINIGPR